MDPRLIQGSLLVVAGYLIGSIPMGVVVARLTGARDPRTVGSGRIGATNSLRAMGARRAFATVLLDVAKGAMPVLLCIGFGADALVQALAGLAAILGACRSVFLRFHGGRGIATGVGATLIIQPLAVLLAVPIFGLIAWRTRLVALASLLGAAACAVGVVVAVVIGLSPPESLVFAVGGALLIWYAHSDSIRRILAGREHRFDFFDRHPGTTGSGAGV